MQFVARPGVTRIALGLMLSAPAFIAAFQDAPTAPGRMETYDDRLVQVEKKAPGFGGMFTAEDGLLVVYLLDPSRIAAARSAIESVFGASYVPPAGLRAARGQYTVSQLKRWSDRATELLRVAGVVFVDFDESRNRVVIGLDDASKARNVKQALKSLGMPLDAFILERKSPIQQLD